MRIATGMLLVVSPLAMQFTPGPKTALTPEQLERLRALGYIR